MMRSIVWMGALLFATSASAALKAGDTVYVRARDTKVLKAPGSTAQVAQLLERAVGRPHVEGVHEVVAGGVREGLVYDVDLDAEHAERGRRLLDHYCGAALGVDVGAVTEQGASHAALLSGSATPIAAAAISVALAAVVAAAPRLRTSRASGPVWEQQSTRSVAPRSRR